MRDIDWASKLTSRKFWLAVAGLISGLVMAFGGTEATATQITALIMSAASVVAFCIGEGLADAAGVKTDTIIVEPDKPPEDEDDMR